LPAPEIVAYTAGDQPVAEAIFQAAWSDGPFPFDPEGAHGDLRRIPEVYQADGGGFWLLRVGDRVVGTVAIRRLPGDIAEVKRLVVLREHRGRGYGDVLFRHALDHARGAGFSRVRLDTIRDTGPALRLYAKHGFREIGRYHHNPDADLFMELDLRSR
jgi:GNAT superfamily N-acetyltransferase